MEGGIALMGVPLDKYSWFACWLVVHFKVTIAVHQNELGALRRPILLLKLEYQGLVAVSLALIAAAAEAFLI